MPRGGARPGAGRKPGAAAIKTAEARNRLAAEGITPLDYMTGVMWGTIDFDEVKFEAAKHAAPYMHARLASVEAKVKATIETIDDADLDQRIAAAAASAGLAGDHTEH